MENRRHLVRAVTAFAVVLTAACGGTTMPTSPTDAPIANAYILPGAIAMGPNAFGDEPVVIHKGERLRWRNLDNVEHDVVADTPTLPEFMTTGPLAPGGEQSFLMNTPGTTKIHCSIHPQMTGTLVVR
jgi:plastocyanin